MFIIQWYVAMYAPGSSHGDVFRLPCLDMEASPAKHLSRGTRQKVSARRSHQLAVNESVKALNHFAGGRTCTSAAEGCKNAASQCTFVTTMVAQQEVLDSLVACHRSFECLERTPQEALLALLRADSVYDQGSANQLAFLAQGAFLCLRRLFANARSVSI